MRVCCAVAAAHVGSGRGCAGDRCNTAATSAATGHVDDTYPEVTGTVVGPWLPYSSGVPPSGERRGN